MKKKRTWKAYSLRKRRLHPLQDRISSFLLLAEEKMKRTPPTDMEWYIWLASAMKVLIEETANPPKAQEYEEAALRRLCHRWQKVNREQVQKTKRILVEICRGATSGASTVSTPTAASAPSTPA
ncbi:MAG: hypothetical protein NTW87_09875 [Planctomycetota bacterium]|nr:hypothetical protein [Planctomycetota bacterium]